MTISNTQDVLLNQIKEKAFISSILAEQSYNYFCFVKNLINIPLIVCNSAMVCINSIIQDQDTLKILNIILNSSTGLILSLISNFKIYEQINQFHQLNIKFNKLSNVIDSKLSNDYDNITADFINSIMDDYQTIMESQDFNYPNKIKKRVKKQYEGKMSLPITLSCEIVECNTKSCCEKV
jgi:hypothetical protein